jgi:rRNA-processing protein FCF1
MQGVIGQADLMMLECVHRELDLLSQQRKGLLLDLLERRSERVSDLEGMVHADEMLVTLSGPRGWPVLTVDRGLKERLISSGGSYIEVTSGRFLRLIET